MSEYDPQKVLQEIKGWIIEEGKFDITKHDNPKAHFGVYMIEKKTPRTIIPILIVYPKQYSVPNTLIIGWGWKMYDIDIKALRAIKDNRIQKVIDGLKRNCLRYNLELNMSPEESFEGVTIAKSIPVEGLTKSTFKNAIVELMAMWALLMHLFEKYNMSRAGFNLSDYI